MSNLVEPHEALLLAEKQAAYHTKAVRHLNCPATELNDLLEIARGLQPKDVFKEYQEIRFVYEYLHMGNGLSAVRGLVKSWIDVRHTTCAVRMGVPLIRSGSRKHRRR